MRSVSCTKHLGGSRASAEGFGFWTADIFAPDTDQVIFVDNRAGQVAWCASEYYAQHKDHNGVGSEFSRMLHICLPRISILVTIRTTHYNHHIIASSLHAQSTNILFSPCSAYCLIWSASFEHSIEKFKAFADET